MVQRKHGFRQLCGFVSENIRYFVLGTMDGVLISVGVTTGAYFSGIWTREPLLIAKTALLASVAAAVSGGIGAFLGEGVETGRKLHGLERRMLRKLRGTPGAKQSKRLIKYSVITSILSTLAGAAIALFPFIFFQGGVAYLISLGLALAFMGVVGFWLGTLAHENRKLWAAKALIATAFLLLVSFLLGAA